MQAASGLHLVFGGGGGGGGEVRVQWDDDDGDDGEGEVRVVVLVMGEGGRVSRWAVGDGNGGGWPLSRCCLPVCLPATRDPLRTRRCIDRQGRRDRGVRSVAPAATAGGQARVARCGASAWTEPRRCTSRRAAPITARNGPPSPPSPPSRLSLFTQGSAAEPAHAPLFLALFTVRAPPMPACLWGHDRSRPAAACCRRLPLLTGCRSFRSIAQSPTLPAPRVASHSPPSQILLPMQPLPITRCTLASA
jgi:hypothetical protein